MTALDAFRDIGVAPGAGAALANARRAQLLLEFAKDATTSLRTWGMRDEQRKDALREAAGAVIVRLFTKGPRGMRQGDPETDEELRSWFRVTVKRELISMWRGRRRGSGSDAGDADLDSELTARPTGGVGAEARPVANEAGEFDVGTVPDPASAGFGELEEHIVTALDSEAVHARLRFYAARCIAAARAELGLNYQRSFDDMLELLLSVAGGQIAVETAANQAGVSRAALEQRFSRLRARIAGQVEALQRRHVLTHFEADAVQVLLDDELRLYELGNGHDPDD